MKDPAVSRSKDRVESEEEVIGAGRRKRKMAYKGKGERKKRGSSG